MWDPPCHMSDWTTVRIRRDLAERVKARGERDGLSFAAWVERALEDALSGTVRVRSTVPRAASSAEAKANVKPVKRQGGKN
jgi:hypothetical protein